MTTAASCRADRRRMLSAPLALHRFHSYAAAFVVFEIMLAVSCAIFPRLGPYPSPALAQACPATSKRCRHNSSVVPARCRRSLAVIAAAFAQISLSPGGADLQRRRARKYS
jgi:hypothetical protein